MFLMITSLENCAMQPVRGCVFRIRIPKVIMASMCAQGEHLDKIILKGEFQEDSTATKYIRN
jgi:hypothetical protein